MRSTDMVDVRIRSFIAVNMSEQAADELELFLRRLKPLSQLRLVSRNQFHITLRFLGEQKPEVIEQVKSLLASIKFTPFDIELSYAGAFPNMRNPRVLWLAGHRGVNELVALVDKIDKALYAVGIPYEKNVFTPHLTLARTKGAQLSQALIDVVKNPPKIVWHCERFNLMRSCLTPRGAMYSKIPFS